MYFVLQTPPLQHLAGVRIVAHLWSQADNFTQIASLQLHAHDIRQVEASEWKAREKRVESKVSVLPLPEQCKNHLLYFIEPLAIEIKDWYRYHSGGRNQFVDFLLGNQLRWTMRGIIDYAKTAELIVKDESLDVERRFELACINCLEDEARELFQTMSEVRRRERMFNNMVGNDAQRTDLHNYLITFFTRFSFVNQLHASMFLPGESSVKKNLFKNSLCRANRATSEYLFKKLDRGEKEDVLEDWHSVIRSCGPSPATCNLLYYLSLMNQEQQRRMFRKLASDVLQCLLRWPLQSLFTEAVECGWGHMSKGTRVYVLVAIVIKILKGFGDYDYSQLFWECWSLSPAEHKQFYFNNGCGILNLLLQTRREEFVKLILNEAPNQKVAKEFNKIRQVLMDESVISEAALMECKQTAALNSSNDKEHKEKRLRSQQLTRLVDFVIEKRRLS